jgi:hypothetical protein
MEKRDRRAAKIQPQVEERGKKGGVVNEEEARVWG